MYWCAIFLAIGFIFCFFFMEETNYDRAPIEMVKSPSKTVKEDTLSKSVDPEKAAETANLDVSHDISTEHTTYKPKTYLQKLALLDRKRPFHLFRMMYRPRLFFSLPSVVYAGFSYGSNLVC
jgi:hypothetical protein